jgi:hypothetical protein
VCSCGLRAHSIGETSWKTRCMAREPTRNAQYCPTYNPYNSVYRSRSKLFFNFLSAAAILTLIIIGIPVMRSTPNGHSFAGRFVNDRFSDHAGNWVPPDSLATGSIGRLGLSHKDSRIQRKLTHARSHTSKICVCTSTLLHTHTHTHTTWSCSHAHAQMTSPKWPSGRCTSRLRPHNLNMVLPLLLFQRVILLFADADYWDILLFRS